MIQINRRTKRAEAAPAFFVTAIFSMAMLWAGGAAVANAADERADRRGEGDTTHSPIRALLITGGGWHDYEAQETLLTEALNERIEIEWTIVHEGDGQPDHHVSVLKEDRWAESYDVVVHNTGFGRVEDGEFVAHFVAHHQGTPAVVIHAGIHSYRYADPPDPWFEFLGLQSMRHEAQRRFVVENIEPDHSVMRGLPSDWETPDNEELYVVEEIRGDITPLARAYGVETEEFHTVAWTHEAQGIRVFCTTLGHPNETFEQAEFLDLVANGVLWATERLESEAD